MKLLNCLLIVAAAQITDEDLTGQQVGKVERGADHRLIGVAVGLYRALVILGPGIGEPQEWLVSGIQVVSHLTDGGVCPLVAVVLVQRRTGDRCDIVVILVLGADTDAAGHAVEPLLISQFRIGPGEFDRLARGGRRVGIAPVLVKLPVGEICQQRRIASDIESAGAGHEIVDVVFTGLVRIAADIRARAETQLMTAEVGLQR